MFDDYSAKSVRKLVDKFFSLQWCRDNLVVPLYEEESKKHIIIAVANYSYLGTIADPIQTRLNQADTQCIFIQKSQDEIKKIIDLASEERFIEGDSQFDEDAVLEAIKETSDNIDQDFKFEFSDNDGESHEEEFLDLAVEMCESQLQNAAGTILINSRKRGVSDIHIEPMENKYLVRVRKDGVMHNFMSLPSKSGVQLIACLKNMALMDIAERRASQDGKIIRKFEGNKIELICSTVSNINGEKMVLRLLNSDASTLNLDTLIHIESVRENFRKLIHATNGIVIVSGPTGSGKSTTLAATLRELDSGDIHIVTAEDPVEYKLGGCINQVQVNRARGQTFAMLLKTFSKQDPDVILIGEIQDPETAELTMDAAETGHLVFTTLHANSSTRTLTRLLDMEVPKYKLNASVRGVLAQRLLRKVCTGCCIKRGVSESESIRFEIDEGTPVMYANALSSEEKLKRKRENTLCPICFGIGYEGRIGVYELLEVNRDVQIAIAQKKQLEEIENIAVNKSNMLTLRKYGLELIKEGLTTFTELERII